MRGDELAGCVRGGGCKGGAAGARGGAQVHTGDAVRRARRIRLSAPASKAAAARTKALIARMYAMGDWGSGSGLLQSPRARGSGRVLFGSSRAKSELARGIGFADLSVASAMAAPGFIVIDRLSVVRVTRRLGVDGRGLGRPVPGEQTERPEGIGLRDIECAAWIALSAARTQFASFCHQATPLSSRGWLCFTIA